MSGVAPAEAMSAKDVWIVYTNWKGETERRHIRPYELYFGAVEWHRGPQWLLSAWDHDKKERRDFALDGIRAWAATAEGLPADAPQKGASE